ncbi:MAG: hypothetical protein OXC61_03145 [Flavobacteriaceae bacterium]|nr:hypothetical protein [Flavobacteriaceae bacterium]
MELFHENEKLKKRIEDLESQKERYGIKWIDKPEAFEKESQNRLPIVTEVKAKAITSLDFSEKIESPPPIF